jgi:hypothetical protein
MAAAWMWLLRSEDGGGILRPWRHLPLRGPASGRGWRQPGPGRCDTDPVLTGTMWHRPGYGTVAAAARSRPRGRQLTPEEPHSCGIHAVEGARRRVSPVTGNARHQEFQGWAGLGTQRAPGKGRKPATSAPAECDRGDSWGGWGGGAVRCASASRFRAGEPPRSHCAPEALLVRLRGRPDFAPRRR